MKGARKISDGERESESVEDCVNGTYVKENELE